MCLCIDLELLASFGLESFAGLERVDQAGGGEERAEDANVFLNDNIFFGVKVFFFSGRIFDVILVLGWSCRVFQGFF